MTDVLEIEAASAPQEAPDAALIHVTLAPKVTFASHQNDIPVLLDLVIENATET